MARIMPDDEAAMLYGKDATEWLARWDSGRPVWSIEMGGLGPGYEQALQMVMVELVRHLLDEKPGPTKWGVHPDDAWADDVKRLEEWGLQHEPITKLGVTGAQFWAAVNLATNLYKRGPVACFTDGAIEARKIQISKNFPGSTL